MKISRQQIGYEWFGFGRDRLELNGQYNIRTVD